MQAFLDDLWPEESPLYRFTFWESARGVPFYESGFGVSWEEDPSGLGGESLPLTKT